LVGLATEWATAGIAAASLVLSVLAAVLFLVARGLQTGRGWARVLGMVAALAALLSSMAMLRSLRRPVPIILGAVGVLLAGYTIWVLGWRFA
jgi:uncharacterized membrane protein (UPF0136 family)